jgi:hypothetical protein
MCVKSENEMKRPLSERPGTEDKRDCSHVSVFLMVTVMATFTVLRIDFMVNITFSDGIRQVWPDHVSEMCPICCDL